MKTLSLTAIVAMSLCILLGIARVSRAEATTLRVYVGTYTGGESKGIYVFDLDLATGKPTQPKLAAEMMNPSFIAIHPSNRYLYAVGEVSQVDGKPGGGVQAFSIEGSGRLTPLNQQSTIGGGPCHLVVDKAGKNVLVANYGGGSSVVLPLEPNGRLKQASSFVQHEGSSVNSRRQQAPHAHSINLDKDNRFAVVADLGLDKLLVYRFEPDAGRIIANDPPAAAVSPGAGPRHFVFHPSGKFAYVINELYQTVTGFSYDADHGTLKTLQTISTVPHPVRGNSTAEIRVHPSGKFLYGSNRGHDSIAMFSIDQQTGMLKAIGHESTQGKTPRNFNIDPTGKYLLAENQGSDTIVLFRIDPDTGKLKATGDVVKVPRPVCVRFVPL